MQILPAPPVSPRVGKGRRQFRARRNGLPWVGVIGGHRASVPRERPPRPCPRPSPPGPRVTLCGTRPWLSRARGLGLLGWPSPAPLLRYTGTDSPSATSVFSTGPQGRVIRPWGPCKALWTARRFGRKLRKATQRRPGPCACWARRALGCAHVARRCLWCLVVHRLTKQRYLFRNPVTQFP